jgi:hypothetical protein
MVFCVYSSLCMGFHALSWVPALHSFLCSDPSCLCLAERSAIPGSTWMLEYLHNVHVCANDRCWPNRDKALSQLHYRGPCSTNPTLVSPSSFLLRKNFFSTKLSSRGARSKGFKNRFALKITRFYENRKYR